MTTTTTETTDITEAREMYELGLQQIADIEREIKDLDEQAKTSRAEIEGIHDSIAVGIRQIQEKRSAIDTLQMELTKAQSYAKLAQGKAIEKMVVKEAAAQQKGLKDAKKELERLEKEQAEIEQAGIHRKQVLTEQIGKANMQKEMLTEQIGSVQSGCDKAQAYYGELQCSATFEEHARHRAKVDEAREQLLQSEIEIELFTDQALETLAPWPDQRRALLLQHGVDDHTTRTINAAINYLTALIDELPRIGSLADVPGQYTSLYDELAINEFLVRGNIGALHDQRRALQHTLQRYSEHVTRR